MDEGREEVRVFATGVNEIDIDEQPTLVESPAGTLALVRRGAAIVAIDAWCPHIDGPLWEGSTSEGEIACPWHGWRYSLHTGACTWAPRGDVEEAAETEIRIYRTRAEAGRIVIDLDSDGTCSRRPPPPTDS